MHGRGEKRVQGFGGKAEGETSHGRPRHRWKNGIGIDLREIDWGVWSGFF
jgi:hypothetical protein